MKLKKFKNLILLGLMLALIFQMLHTGMIVAQAAPVAAIHERLEGITSEEKKVLEELFIISQDIAEAEWAEELLVHEIAKLHEDIVFIENRLQEEEVAFKQKLGILQEVLRGYQKRGVASYLHIILTSNGLSDLVKRINIIREFSRNTGGLLEEIEGRRELLASEEALLSNKLAASEDKRLELRELVSVKAEARSKLEEYLISLGGERQFYEENLALLREHWSELSESITGIREAIIDLIADNNLPREAFRITYGLLGARVSINQADFNKLLQSNGNLSMLEFKFLEDRVALSVKDKGLELTGKFIVETRNNIQLVVEEGAFYNIPLQQEAIVDLFKEGPIIIDLSAAFEGNSIRAISVNDGYIELLVVPVLSAGLQFRDSHFFGRELGISRPLHSMTLHLDRIISFIQVGS